MKITPVTKAIMQSRRRQSMPRYRVAICHEESVVIELSADDEHQAEELAYDLADEYGTDVPPQYQPETVHRQFFTQDAKEIDDA